MAAETREPYGLLVEIDHGGRYRTRYAQLQTLAVAMANPVRAGQAIGQVGSSDEVMQPHLHFEVWYKTQLLDPTRVLTPSKDYLT